MSSLGRKKPANEELGASLVAMEQMQTKSDEWLAVSSMILSSPDYLDTDQMVSTVKDLQSGLDANPAPTQNQNVREMAAFLTNVRGQFFFSFFFLC